MEPEKQTYKVVAYRIDDGKPDGVMGEGLSLRNAEAVSNFCVARRGVDIHFFAVEPEAALTPKDHPHE